jgi:hypothetical protein
VKDSKVFVLQSIQDYAQAEGLVVLFGESELIGSEFNAHDVSLAAFNLKVQISRLRLRQEIITAILTALVYHFVSILPIVVLDNFHRAEFNRSPFFRVLYPAASRLSCS